MSSHPASLSVRSLLSRLLKCGVLPLLVPIVLSAQTIALDVGDSARVNVAPSAKVRVPIILDITNQGAQNIASLQAGLSWNAARLTYDSLRVVSPPGWSVTTNASNAGTGSLTFNGFGAEKLAVTGAIVNVWFSASAATGGTRVTISPSAAGTEGGASVLSLLRPRNLDVCVAPSGRWGDVNDDGVVNIIDAQQIARFSVGLSVANAVAVGARGDVTADASVNILDAQQIARFSVGLSAAARTNTLVFTAPTAASVEVSPSGAQAVAVGGTLQLTATPRDGTNVELSGCAAVTWTTSAANVATVSTTGLVTGLANGTATITATSGAQAATVTVTVGAGEGAASLELVDGVDLAAIPPVSLTQRVRALSSTGTPVPGVPVTFTVTSGTWTLNAGGGASNTNSVTITTDELGLASVFVLNGVEGGSATVSVSAAGVPTRTFATSVLNPDAFGGAVLCVNDGYSLRCWGDGTRGQLGNGTTTSSATPVPVTLTGISFTPATGVVTREGRGEHNCLLDAGGSAWCWGWNEAGQLGDSSTVTRSVPVRVKTAQTFTAIAAGSRHTCALTSAGTAWCWGGNYLGQLGDSTRYSRRTAPVPVRMPVGVLFTKIALAQETSCGGTAAGQWYCWGNNNLGVMGNGVNGGVHLVPTPAAGGLSFIDFSISDFGACGLTATGNAMCWGSQGQGLVGNGVVNTPAVTTPVPVLGGHAFTSVRVSSFRACATKANGELWCWGWNSGGMLADSTTITRAEPYRIGFTGTVEVMAGSNNTSSSQASCGLTQTARQLFCWGGRSGASTAAWSIGDGTVRTGRNFPFPISRSGATANEATSVSPVNASPSLALLTGVPMAAPGLTVLVRDGAGAAVANAVVTWTVISGPASFGGQATVTSTTDANGLATSGVIEAGATEGAVSIRASVPGTGPAGAGLITHAFNGFVTAAPAQIVAVGTPDVVHSGAGPALPSVVEVRTSTGAPVPNVAVEFAVRGAGGTLFGGSRGTVFTDASGQARVVSWLPSTTVGTTSRLVAQVAGVADSAVFTALRSGITAGSRATSCELSAAGSAYCWGANGSGQVGDGTTTNRSVPTLVSGGLTFASLSAGQAEHRCALTVAGAAYCWGVNDVGQLGDGTYVNRSTPTLVSGGLTFTQLVTQGSATCGVTTANQVFCWGWTTLGGLAGDLPSQRVNVPTLVNLGGVAAAHIAMTDESRCLQTTEGAVHCWGGNRNGELGTGSTVAYSSALTSVSGSFAVGTLRGGTNNFCALTSAGAAWCWGGATLNGNGSSAQSSSPVAVSGGYTFASLEVGHSAACGRQTDGSVRCWGAGAQLGLGGGSSFFSPAAAIAGLEFTRVRMTGGAHVCGVAVAGMVYCWGLNGSGQIGDGTTVQRTLPVPVTSSWPDGPAAGVAVSMAVSAGGGQAAPTGTAVLVAPSVVVRDRTGAPVPGVSVTFAVTAGGGSVTGATAVTDASGIATVGSWVMGAAGLAQRMLATASALPSAEFTATSVVPAASITSSANTVQYGASFETNTRSPVGVSVRDASNTPIANFPVVYTIGGGGGTVAGGTTQTVLTNASGVAASPTWVTPTTAGSYTLVASAVGVATTVTFTWNKTSEYGGQNSCRLRADGQAMCWGNNDRGQLGDGTTTRRTAPTLVSGGQAFVALAEGSRSQHNCALTSTGQAWCWGYNVHGELGNGTQSNSTVPVQVSGGLTFTKLYKGMWSTCGITSGNQTYCWGWTSRSRFGDGVYADIQLTPRLVNTNGVTFAQLALALEGTCGITATGATHCWGMNLGETGTRDLPSATPLSGIALAQLSAGDRGYCGVTTAGGVRCWGENGTGQLGNGTTTFSTTPVTPSGVASGMVEVRHASWTTVCARGTTGNMWCWGSNSFGQVGDGRSGDGGTLNQTTPVRIGAGVRYDGALSVPGLTFTGFHAAGSDGFFCALVAGDTPPSSVCWGQDPVGDATDLVRSMPTAIAWPEGTAGIARSMVVTGSASDANPSAIPAGTAGAAVTAPISVLVRDVAGSPVSGVAVNFAVRVGGGSPAWTIVNTNALGIATLPSLLYGPAGTTTTVVAHATNLPGVAFVVPSSP